MSDADPFSPWPLRLIDRLSALFAILAAGALVLLVCTVTIDVAGRSLFHRPLPGALEITAHWWMPMLTLLAMGFAERAGEQIRVTLLLDALPARLRHGVEGAFALASAALLALLAWYTLQEALHGAALGRTTASRPPVAIWPFAFVAVGGLVMLALQCLASAWRGFARMVRA